jgi:RNA polymerase sigma factor (TIGR02999 family)
MLWRVWGGNAEAPNANLVVGLSSLEEYLLTSPIIMSDVTRILNAIEHGDAKAADELLPLVYQELRRLAAHKMANEAPGHTLQPTALVHEAYLRLVGAGQAQQWDGRGHFFAAAAEAMRRILVESARRKKRLKHGGELQRVDMDELELASPLPDDELLALDEALDRLATVDSRAAVVVKLCFFVGLTQEQAAKELGISLATAERLWSFARAWLFQEMQKALKPTP